MLLFYRLYQNTHGKVQKESCRSLYNHCMNAECHGILRVRNCNVIARECISWNVVVYVDVNQLSCNGNMYVFRVLTTSLQLCELYDHCVHAKFHDIPRVSNCKRVVDHCMITV